jgi:sugar lactone lactonase YvrE
MLSLLASTPRSSFSPRTFAAASGAALAGILWFFLAGIAHAQESANWAVSTFAGQAGASAADDGTAGSARFNAPRGVVVDSVGQVFVADTVNHTIRKISPGGAVTTFVGAAGSSGSSDGSGGSARFNSPAGLAIDSAGNLYVADMMNHTIRKISPEGAVSTLAGSAGSSGSSDGTGGGARFQEPVGVAVDSTGNVYVADSGNSTIRKVTPQGTVTTVAGSAGESGRSDGASSLARFDHPYGVTVDLSGTIYVADTFNHSIRRITGDGQVTTWAGLSGTSGSNDGGGTGARFSGPAALAVDQLGNVYVTETANHLVRLISSGTSVSVLAGAAGQDGSSDGAGTNARFNGPSGIAVGLSNTLYVSDTVNSTVRKIVRVQVTAPSPLPDNPNGSRLVNISTRSYVGTGSSIQIAGLVIRGSQPKQVLIRASGPALNQVFGLGGVLADPTLTLFSSNGAEIGKNDDWAADADRISTAASRVGAFSWTRGSKDAALLISLAPGSYTAHVAGKDGGTGVALIEAYEADEVSSDSKLVNISTRSEVRTGGDIQIAGFVVRGSTAKRLLIRASGPALADFGLTNNLADPMLLVYSGSGSLIGQSDDWQSDEAAIESAAAQAGAFGWKRGSKDAAVVMTLEPGTYTAHVKGKADGTGVGLIEVYELE